LTSAQLRCAQQYQEDDVIHFDCARKKQGIDKASYLTIVAVNREANSLTFSTADG
jgi:hypothetical protein